MCVSFSIVVFFPNIYVSTGIHGAAQLNILGVFVGVERRI